MAERQCRTLGHTQPALSRERRPSALTIGTEHGACQQLNYSHSLASRGMGHEGALCAGAWPGLALAHPLSLAYALDAPGPAGLLPLGGQVHQPDVLQADVRQAGDRECGLAPAWLRSGGEGGECGSVLPVAFEWTALKGFERGSMHGPLSVCPGSMSRTWRRVLHQWGSPAKPSCHASLHGSTWLPVPQSSVLPQWGSGCPRALTCTCLT